MFKVIGFIFLVHAAYSLMRLRQYLTFNNRMNEFTIPIDILCEIFLGLFLNLFLGVIFDKPYEDIHEFKIKQSYDISFSRPNFKNLEMTRGKVLVRFLKDKLNHFDLTGKA